MMRGLTEGMVRSLVINDHQWDSALFTTRQALAGSHCCSSGWLLDCFSNL